MLKRLILVVVVSVAAAGRSAELPSLPKATSNHSAFRLNHCLVTLIDDVEVAAEKAGVIKSLAVREGDYLAKGTPIAAIDDEQAGLIHESSAAEAEAARAKADSTLEVEYAVATHRTAEAEVRMAMSANAKQANAVSTMELERLKLAMEQARIKTGVTKFERVLRVIEARGFEAKAQLAATDVRIRKILAPLEGEVVEVYFGAGEWVEPGKPVARLVRLDRLRAEGFVKFSEHSPGSMIGRSVKVFIDVADGRREAFSGKVTFVNPIVQPGGEYRIWAEIENRREGKQWLLRPGLEVEMEVGEAGSMTAIGDTGPN